MRILSVTAETSLAVAVSMIDGWEVVTAQDVDEAVTRAPGSAALLIGVGATDEGIALVEQLHGKGVVLPAVVVGDHPGPEESPAVVVVRPFSLEDLQNAVATALRESGTAELNGDLASPPAVVVEETPPAAEPVKDAPEAVAGKGAISDRIAAAARAFGDIDALLEELPMLWDLSSMSEALLSEVTRLFAPQTASVFVRVGEGFRVFASHGLSRMEARTVVSETHPLFGEIARTLETILIAPVSSVPEMVAGIGGARTETLIAAPVTVDGRCVAVVVAGRKNFSKKDRDPFGDLAREAGPGFVLAAALERFRRGA